MRLGVGSFGGPIAHLGYFRAAFVERRHWLGEREFAELVGLCQVLPGPSSSQTGFAIGLMRAGYTGGLAAWAGFTLPSAFLMTVFASFAGRLGHSAAGDGLLHGLKLVAVAIVAQAVWGMARTMCPDRLHAMIAVLAVWIVVLTPAAMGQIGAILAGSAAGLAFRGNDGGEADLAMRPRWGMPVSQRAGVGFLMISGALLAICLHPGGQGGLAAFSAFYRSGALVFGGAHVVLPLLRDSVVTPGWVSSDAFLAGYGAAQALPGPLFSFAAYLGAILPGRAGGLAGAALALGAIFLPGLLLLLGILPFWDGLRAHPYAASVLKGVNAAVVGLLAAALYDPVWTGAVHSTGDFALALAGFVLLAVWRAPPVMVVALGIAAGLGLSAAGQGGFLRLPL